MYPEHNQMDPDNPYAQKSLHILQILTVNTESEDINYQKNIKDLLKN